MPKINVTAVINDEESATVRIEYRGKKFTIRITEDKHNEGALTLRLLDMEFEFDQSARDTVHID